MNYPGELGQLSRLGAQMALADCADQSGNDLQAAEALTGAQETLKTLPMSGANAVEGEELLRASVLWHQLRAAINDANQSEMARLVDRLGTMEKIIGNGDSATDLRIDAIEIHVDTMDLRIDMVRALKQLGRTAEAQDLFRKAYIGPRAVLDREPHNPKYLNNLAWLCARCGEHAAEAYQQANEAIKRTPLGDDDAAPNLDTAAEVAAAVGKWDEAVQHETDALRLMPEDWFMRGQLARFQAELDKQHAKP
jgi:tetratricopeptide (TPR) repeat protein